MSALSELKAILDHHDVPVETGVFSSAPPDTYAVLTPLVDVFDLFADNMPGVDICEVRVSVFTKQNYLQLVSVLVTGFLTAGFTITERRYLGHEDDTGYHHYSIDTAKEYYIKEETT
ncbi:MAG: hypothetical protein IJU01_06760 [Lachnospiraceae bacterium]|nr:hypothetical protein [Lachnospiraceae bacterium]